MHIILVNIDIINHNTAHIFFEIVETQKNVRQRALTAPRVTNECNLGSGRYLKIEVVEYFRRTSRVVEGHILEFNQTIFNNSMLSLFVWLADVKFRRLIDNRKNWNSGLLCL